MAEGKRDNKAPSALIAEIRDGNGKIWSTIALDGKNFSTGSVGFYGSGKVVNPENPEAKYQIGFNLTLVGSKPGA